jgi:CBS domain containing-hemolysin-like protein
MSMVLPERRPDPADDVRLIAREGRANGLGGDQLVMVGGVMTFSERSVRSVMTPRTAVIAVARDAPHQEVLNTFTESGYTRLPVYGDSLDEILGMVHAFDLFKVEEEEALPLRPVTFAPESRQAGDLLLDMQRERRHFAVVLDEFGGTAGIVTLEDLLEGLVGEISGDDEEVIAAPTGGADLFEFDGSISPEELEQRCHVELPRGEAVSFGGLLAELLGRIPLTGERFVLRGMEVDILQATPTKIERLLVRCKYVAPIPLDRDGP